MMKIADHTAQQKTEEVWRSALIQHGQQVEKRKKPG